MPTAREKRGAMNETGAVMKRDVLNVEEAAQYLGFSAYTVREKARDGEIPGRKIGKEWRFSRRRLLEWLEAGESQRTRA
jgi:excisionase family DNA binding protein